MAGLVVLAAIGVILLASQEARRRSHEIERERRAYLNRVGRIVEGQILEVSDRMACQPTTPSSSRTPANSINSGYQQQREDNRCRVHQRHAAALYYTYSISGVTYETAQDVTGLEERLHLKRVAVGQTASVKYDPSNPSNSILLADDWSGLH